MSVITNDQRGKPGFEFADHPWISMLLMNIVGIALILFMAVFARLIGLPGDAPYRPLIQPTLAHILTLFVIAPFILRIPNGKRTFRQYLNDIRLSRVRPFLPLLVLAISCTLIWLLSATAGSIIYRLSQGLPITGVFLSRVIDVRADLPPRSMSWLVSFPSIFEEVAWRGVLLALFLRKYSERKSILFTALGFGLLHLLNLVDGASLVWVIGQALWGTALGIFYGFLVLRTGSLMPAMIFHYLGNMFIGSFSIYLQNSAPLETLVPYAVVYTFCALPLLILWIKYFSDRWLTGPSASIPAVLHGDTVYG